MKPSLSEAYKRLELVEGSDLPAVRKKFVQLYTKLKDKKDKVTEICAAYRRIVSPDDEEDLSLMNMDKMKSLIDSIFSQYKQESSLNDDDIAYVSSSEEDISDEDDKSNGESVHAEEGYDKVARELIADEEKRKADEKRRAEKRRAKKKKRREKKRLEKENEVLSKQTTVSKSETVNDSYNGVRSSDEGEGIDPNAAFVKKSKKKFAEPAVHKTNTETHNKTHQKENQHTDESSASRKSQDIAMEGNKKAHSGDYPEAIKLFTEAIRLLPSDYRFYGNRSFCYDKMLQYTEALADAEKSIELAPDIPKGYFRKGRALAGQKKYSDAEVAFKEVLRLDRNCEEATKELYRVRVRYLVELGFSNQQADQAARTFNSLRKAVDSLLLIGAEKGGGEPAGSESDGESSNHRPTNQNSTQRQIVNKNIQPKNTSSNQVHLNGTSKSVRGQDTHQEEKKMDPTNPEGLTALWVGNVLPSVKDSDLQKLFSRYGSVSSVRTLPEKYCAFVNFRSKDAAEKAMNALQNHEVKGQKLLIKFPDNPVSNGATTLPSVKPSVVIPPPTKQMPPQSQKPFTGQHTVASKLQAQKASGPVNGDECYFWRTTGCQFGQKCRHRHVPENKGIDKKPWQRVK